MRIVILSAAPNSEATQSIKKAGEKRGHEMSILDSAHLYLKISDNSKGFDAIYDGYGTDDKPEKIKLSEVDAVISRIGTNFSYGCAVLEHFRNNLGIFTTQSPEGLKTAADKLISLQKMSAAGLKVPKTIMGDNIKHLDWVINEVGGLPAIAKTLKGSQGLGVIILESRRQTGSMLESFYKQGEKLLIQKFIDGANKDIRAIVIDSKVVVAMERTAPKGEYRANISKGGSGRKVELSETDKQICIDAANSCGLSVAGVDIMKDAHGNTFVIEVNGNYGYKVQDITKVDISTPLIEYCEKNGKGKRQANESEPKKENSFMNKVTSLFVTEKQEPTAAKKQEPTAAKKQEPTAAEIIKSKFHLRNGNDKQIFDSCVDNIFNAGYILTHDASNHKLIVSKTSNEYKQFPYNSIVRIQGLGIQIETKF